MLSAKLLIPAVAVGLLALVGYGSTANAKPSAKTAPPAKPGADRIPPPELLAKINGAFLGADPSVLRKTADQVEAAGFQAQADDLRAFAQKIDTAIAAYKADPSKPPEFVPFPPSSVPGATKPGPVPSLTPAAAGAPVSSASGSSGGAVEEMPTMVITASGPTPAQKILAGRTALMLMHSKRGSEDQGLVSTFQAQEEQLGHAPGGAFGSAPSKADGLYGAKTALVLAKTYGIVPPKPLYWAKGTWLADKKAYRSELARLAANDLPRADEWSSASKVL